MGMHLMAPERQPEEGNISPKATLNRDPVMAPSIVWEVHRRMGYVVVTSKVTSR